MPKPKVGPNDTRRSLAPRLDACAPSPGRCDEFGTSSREPQQEVAHREGGVAFSAPWDRRGVGKTPVSGTIHRGGGAELRQIDLRDELTEEGPV